MEKSIPRNYFCHWVIYLYNTLSRLLFVPPRTHSYCFVRKSLPRRELTPGIASWPAAEARSQQSAAEPPSSGDGGRTSQFVLANSASFTIFSQVASD